MCLYQPDVVVVDFSVNDDADEFFQETYEGVIRKLLSFRTKPAVLVLNNVFYDTGENANSSTMRWQITIMFRMSASLIVFTRG